MSYTTVINRIDTNLKAVTGVVDSNVYKYERHTKHWSEYISSFKDTVNNKIHGYIITQVGFESILEAGYVTKTTRTWLIRAFYGMGSSGATENTTFQPLLDSIKTKFIADSRLGGTVLTTNSIRVTPIDLLMFGDTLCHHADIYIETEEEERHA